MEYLLLQMLNGVQLGLLMFLLAAGLTLDLRHHGPGEPGARLALHDGRLHRLDADRLDRFLRAGRAAGAARHLPAGHRRRGHRDATALCARPSRPGAGDLRADPVLQRAGARDLGAGRQEHRRAGVPQPHRRDPARRALPRLPLRHHRRRRAGRDPAGLAGGAHAPRHADPRRRLQPAHDRRARRQHRAAVHVGVRPRRGVRRAWPA